MGQRSQPVQPPPVPQLPAPQQPVQQLVTSIYPSLPPNAASGPSSPASLAFSQANAKALPAVPAPNAAALYPMAMAQPCMGMGMGFRPPEAIPHSTVPLPLPVPIAMHAHQHHMRTMGVVLSHGHGHGQGQGFRPVASDDSRAGDYGGGIPHDLLTSTAAEAYRQRHEGGHGPGLPLGPGPGSGLLGVGPLTVPPGVSAHMAYAKAGQPQGANPSGKARRSVRARLQRAALLAAAIVLALLALLYLLVSTSHAIASGHGMRRPGFLAIASTVVAGYWKALGTAAAVAMFVSLLTD